ncbi:MAG: DUF4019 domain-containing protein [Pseudomonadota bacterium]
MAAELQRLSDKEKEVLRLITRGHDAKTAAQTLNLSVHTINDRLRSVRSKLNVTSSREAARLLFETEEPAVLGDPNNLARKSLAGAQEAISSEPPSSAATPRSHALWIGGITVMLMLALAASLLTPTTATQRQVGDPATPLEAVQLAEFERVARAWLTLVDQGNWEASFGAAGESFQEPNTVKTWREASQLARVPLGEVIERRNAKAEFVNAPPHGFVVMEFSTDFSEREGVVEKVTLEKEADGWKVVAYVIE